MKNFSILCLLVTVIACVAWGPNAAAQGTTSASPKIDIWKLPPLAVHPGAFEPNWDSLSKYEAPEWYREAKFGIWAHWDPQSVPEQGDWYSRNMYVPGHRQNAHCMKTYGHPSEFGYKDICGMWKCDRWNPEAFMQLAVEAGGKYFVALANHHDNYDCWDSTYQPWNSVNLGPKKDVVGIWAQTARQYNLPFGVTVHATPARTWGQFMPPRYLSDPDGPKKGVPYEAVTATIEDGTGKPWEGLDPKDLYGPKHTSNEDANASPFANQFMWRVNDLLKYNPELLYFDESVGNNQVDLNVKMGFGYLAPIIAANYYNRSMEANNGKLVAVLNIKEVGGHRNSLSTLEEARLVEQCLVKDSEKKTEKSIQAYPFQTDDSIGPWHMDVNRPYSHDARWVIHTLINNVSKNGNLLLNIPQRAQGNVDDEAAEICREIGAWLNANGEAIYGSRPFEVYRSAKQPVYFTRRGGHVYASLLKTPKSKSLTIAELKSNGATLGKVESVQHVASGDSVPFEQSKKGLTLTLPNTDSIKIASVFKITHSKHAWVNDDDPGLFYRGWVHEVNRDRGEFNNDVYESTTRGARCRFAFEAAAEGTVVKLVANTNPDAGDLMVIIDGVFDQIIKPSATGEAAVQQVVYESNKLSTGKHTLEVVKLDERLSTIDAFTVE